VLLVYQKISPSCRAEIALPSSLHIDEIINQGLDNLQRVGGEMHPLASRYVHSFKQLQSRLRAMGDLCANSPSQMQRPMARPTSTSGWKLPLPSRREDYTSAEKEKALAQGLRRDNTNCAVDDVAQEESRPVEYNDYWTSGFDDEFAILQSVLLDNADWTGLVNDWEYN
jgi:hypothetical protein